ncbi:MAG: LuxR family glucitol operon transcriptional activator [Colwellia sp.]|jgi:LuxR family glucitol operon transcriptional activator
MSSRNFATRMSCFSLISSIEIDLRTIIIDQLPDEYDYLLPIDILKTAKERYLYHKKEVFTKENVKVDLLDFIDFYDLSKILNKLSKIQNVFSIEELKHLTTEIEKLSPCRNRVCHSRPLESHDFTELLDFSYDLTKIKIPYKWKNINQAIQNLDNPKYALSLEIPKFWRKNAKEINNNLPITEFDDTGFMGRDKDRKTIFKLLTSNTKVISIVGEGGVGKTALAQRCLYDILDFCESNTATEPFFDIIVWVQLKTNKLTINGTVEIANAINTSTGLFQEISQTLGGITTSNLEDNLAEISEYMEEFKILLCIDNLETISSSEVRDFLANIPNSSKVLITTRIGLGEIEYRYKLDKLDDKPSIELMRNMSRLLNVDKLIKKKNDALKQLCKILYNNPLLIKWYVLSVAAGNDKELINKQGSNFQDALRFCFENLYDKLGSVETQAISIIACMRKAVSAVELRFFMNEIPEIEIEEALNQLHNSSMLISTDGSLEEGGQLYSLTGVASEYINSVRPVSTENYKKIKVKKKELQLIIDETSINKHHYNYDLNTISWSNRDEKICAIYLKKALTEARKGNEALANQHIIRAKSLMPDFSECYRIHSFLLKDSSPFQAEAEMEKAIELNPNSVISRYAYAQFLISEEEFPRANEQIDFALLIDDDDIALQTCKAWILTLRGDYDSAATLYDALIPRQASRHRKFRISTFDQAANCYKRKTEQLIKDGDYTKAKVALKHSIKLIEEAINTDDYDHGSVNRLCELLITSEHYAVKTNDKSFSEDILLILEANVCKFTVSSIQRLKLGIERFIKLYPKSYLLNIDKILDAIKPKNSSYGKDRIKGTIDLVSSTDRGVSFGFINALDNQRYFFHRSELQPDTMLDKEYRDINVCFLAGENEKGICALDIKELF